MEDLSQDVLHCEYGGNLEEIRCTLFQKDTPSNNGHIEFEMLISSGKNWEVVL